MGHLDALFLGLDQFDHLAIEGAVEGLRVGAQDLQDDLRATGAYTNQTGATRAGTVAYVIGPGYDGSDLLEQAASEAEALNPGHSQATAAGDVPDDSIAVIATSATDYAKDVETAKAGERAFLGPGMLQHGQRLTQAAADGIRRRLS